MGQQTATLTASGATTYIWSPATGLSATTGSSVTANPSSTSTYTVVGTDNNGCTASTQVTVNVNPLPVVTVTSAAICNGQSTPLTASGATTYSWSPATDLSSTTGATVTANPTSTITYTVTGTDANGCTSTGQGTVTVTTVIVTVSPNTAICNGMPTTLTASGATTYSWSPSSSLSSSTGSSVNANPTTNTTYTVIGTTNGCTASAQVTVTVNGIILIVSPNVSICNGQSTTLTATGATTYSWTPSTGLSSTTGSPVTANPTATTTYTVTGTSNGCSATGQVTVTVNPLPVVTVTTPPAICVGQQSATLTAGGAATYTWSPATGLSATTGVTVTATPATTTSYTVTGTDVNGCSASAQTTVTVNPLPVIAVAPATICNGQSATLTANGATTYAWSPATALSATTGSSVSANPTSTITYTVTGTDINSCTASTQVTVTVNSLPVITVAPATICTGQSATLTASGASTYTWSPATALSATTGSTVTANPTSTSTYTVTGTDNNGCVSSTQVTVTVNALPVVTVTSASICNGQSTTLTASGASTYSWSPATNLSATIGATLTANPTSTITYTVTGTDANGCTSTGQGTVTVTTVVVSVSPNTAICNGMPTTLTAGGATTYSWSPSSSLSSSTGSSVTANPTVNTTYTVIGTTNGCTASAQVTVTVNGIILVVSPNVSICNGQSTSLTATGATTYTWSPATGLSSTTGSPVNASPTATTTYTVTGTSNGCSATGQVTVTVNPLPVVTVNTPSPICAGQSVTLTAGGASTYSWSPSTGLSATTGTSVTANPASTTTYTITGTDVNGCTATAQTTVTVNPVPGASFNSNVTNCSLNVSFVNTSAGAVSYAWNFGDASTSTSVNPTHSYSSTGSYNVTLIAISAAGCSDTFSAPVQLLFTIPTTGFTFVNPPCTNTINFTNQSTGATSYNWNFGDASTSTSQNPSHNYSSSGNYLVTLVSTSSSGCTDTTAQIVTLLPVPNASFVPIVDTCALSAAFFNSSSNAVSYLWNFGDLSTSTTLNPFHTYTQFGTYTITLIVTNASGCSDTTTQNITLPAVAQASFTFAVDSCLRFATFTNTSLNGFSYYWNFGDGNNSTQQSPTHTYSANNIYNVTLIVTGNSGCNDTITQPVPVSFTPPVAAFNHATPACSFGTSFSNQSTPVTSFNWDFGDNTHSSLANPSHDYQQPGNYSVMLIAVISGGCVDTATHQVVIDPLPVASFIPDIDTCSLNASFINNSLNASTYSWNFGDNTFSTSAVPTHTYPSSGSYNVTLIITDSNGCSDSVMHTVNPFILSQASYTYVIDSCARQVNFLNTTGLAYGYQWDFGDGETSSSESPVHNYYVDGNYTITLIANPGTICADTAIEQVDFNVIAAGNMWVPNAFTPNYDGKNEIFEIVGTRPCENLTFSIFNRWGELIYQTSTYPLQWDGRYRGDRV